VHIGGGSSSFLTTFQDFYRSKKAVYSMPSQKLKEHHTGTHFKTGTDKHYFSSVAQNAFLKPPYKPKIFEQKNLLKTNYELGIGRNNYKSSYRQFFKKYSGSGSQ